jgi:hypothetical protein
VGWGARVAFAWGYFGIAFGGAGLSLLWFPQFNLNIYSQYEISN